MTMKPTPGCSDIDLEFDRLRNFREIYLNADLVAFVKKAHASIQSQRRFEERDCINRSLLHYAAIGNCTNLLQCLLKEKPYVDSRDNYGRTPFSWAAEHGSLDVAEILLERGAKINALDYSGGLPLTWLINAGNPDMTDLEAAEAWLRHRGAKKSKLRHIKLAWILVLKYSRLLR
jgi:ankyrin repeat protein